MKHATAERSATGVITIHFESEGHAAQRELGTLSAETDWPRMVARAFMFGRAVKAREIEGALSEWYEPLRD